jgi:hypothetical protein
MFFAMFVIFSLSASFLGGVLIGYRVRSRQPNQEYANLARDAKHAKYCDIWRFVANRASYDPHTLRKDDLVFNLFLVNACFISKEDELESIICDVERHLRNTCGEICVKKFYCELTSMNNRGYVTLDAFVQLLVRYNFDPMTRCVDLPPKS